jgi:hypothetical protein
MAKKLTPEKAREMLHNPPHGKPLTEKQRKFFGYMSNQENGGWLEKYNDGGPVQENYNDYSVSAGPGFQGDGYFNEGRNYSPAWGGQFAMGGSLPGSVGFMYARTHDPAPSEGPYAKKTEPSAENGTEMKFYQQGLDFKPKTISRDGSQLKKLDQLTNFTNYNATQPSGWLEKYQ